MEQGCDIGDLISTLVVAAQAEETNFVEAPRTLLPPHASTLTGMSSEANPGLDMSSDEEDKWEKLTPALLVKKRLYEKKEWLHNKVVPLMGINATDATKDNAERTYNKEG